MNSPVPPEIAELREIANRMMSALTGKTIKGLSSRNLERIADSLQADWTRLSQGLEAANTATTHMRRQRDEARGLAEGYRGGSANVRERYPLPWETSSTESDAAAWNARVAAPARSVLTDEAQRLAQWCREQGRSKAWAPETLDIFNAIASLLEREAPRPREPSEAAIEAAWQAASGRPFTMRVARETLRAAYAAEAASAEVVKHCETDAIEVRHFKCRSCGTAFVGDFTQSGVEREAPHPMIRGTLQEKLAMAEALLIKHLDELTEAERQLDAYKREREAPKDAPK